MRENLKATKSFTYAGRALRAGDEFDAPRSDARVLRALGRAVHFDTYETTAAAPAVTKAAETTQPAKAAAKRTPSKKADAK
ncbi:hypothetical protein QRO08_15820 [Paracidovorax citrulli]|uniref:Uncharacterized protein n=2 Tax=Paracidovorax citrulli TaxID=80869 RepID=A1TN18_PARC0|nr:hypothetical protein [Paracidovorax citrulli]ABM32356.1 hypothetical protein Aave_1771 [Paracidovorax citrulli AAC00-1]ATG94623.1 hypothetical protein CQB05_11805 [Paracidovorax citrulli]MVT28510.1 hypothetical protein [Paracidovorax citrulli]MVT38639.1 hypothetical protein [Paracidovorax citrulli]PVY66571.1 hypothetical protein C8E08_3981 [Paracidovorax citrulli]